MTRIRRRGRETETKGQPRCNRAPVFERLVKSEDAESRPLIDQPVIGTRRRGDFGEGGASQSPATGRPTPRRGTSWTRGRDCVDGDGWYWGRWTSWSTGWPPVGNHSPVSPGLGTVLPTEGSECGTEGGSELLPDRTSVRKSKWRRRCVPWPGPRTSCRCGSYSQPVYDSVRGPAVGPGLSSGIRRRSRTHTSSPSVATPSSHTLLLSSLLPRRPTTRGVGVRHGGERGPVEREGLPSLLLFLTRESAPVDPRRRRRGKNGARDVPRSR